MTENFLAFASGAWLSSAEQALTRANEKTRDAGLALSPAQIHFLTLAHLEALQSTGRMEMGAGALPKLMEAFCDSPFLTRDNYAQTLAELQDAFYYFKNESEDRIADDELVELMRDVFNGRAQGSMEYLIGTSLEELCRWARGGDQWDE